MILLSNLVSCAMDFFFLQKNVPTYLHVTVDMNILENNFLPRTLISNFQRRVLDFVSSRGEMGYTISRYIIQHI